MSQIKNKDTKPEVTLRKALFARGFRYRVNVKTLPGKPDIVLHISRAGFSSFAIFSFTTSSAL